MRCTLHEAEPIINHDNREWKQRICQQDNKTIQGKKTAQQTAFSSFRTHLIWSSWIIIVLYWTNKFFLCILFFLRNYFLVLVSFVYAFISWYQLIVLFENCLYGWVILLLGKRRFVDVVWNTLRFVVLDI